MIVQDFLNHYISTDNSLGIPLPNSLVHCGDARIERLRVDIQAVGDSSIHFLPVGTHLRNASGAFFFNTQPILPHESRILQGFFQYFIRRRRGIERYQQGTDTRCFFSQCSLDLFLYFGGVNARRPEKTVPYFPNAGLIQAANCGVRLIATAHGSGLQDLRQRPLYQPLLDRKIFQTIVLLNKDKSYSVERVVS